MKSWAAKCNASSTKPTAIEEILPPSDQKAAEIFRTITQPLQQIHLLVEGVFHIFDLEKPPPPDLRVTLARMQGSKFLGFEYSLPKSEYPTDADAFPKRKSGFSIAAEAKRMVIIEDIEKKLSKAEDKRRFARIEGADNRGSILLFPVTYGPKQDVPFVISVMTSRPYYFSECDHRRLETIMKKFEKRIAMEYSLLILKGET